jgi:putative transposon-encoded protein
MKITIENVEAIIESEVKSYTTSTRVSVPKKWANRKVKIILIKE